jgi:hypothetical protein
MTANSQMIIVEPVHVHERTNNSTFQNADIFVDDGLVLALQQGKNYLSNDSVPDNKNRQHLLGNLLNQNEVTIEEHREIPPEMFKI